jgi:hypothetical protein
MSIFIFHRSLIWTHQVSAKRALCIYTSFLRPDLLHLLAMLALWLFVSDAHFLKEDVRSVVDRTCIPGGRALFRKEVVQSFGCDFLFIRVRLCNFSAEPSLSDAGMGKVGIDLLANLIACIVNRDRCIFFAVKVDAGNVVQLIFLLLANLLLLRWLDALKPIIR